MDDKELLELAAKAAGMVPRDEWAYDEEWGLKVSDGLPPYEWWNPLADHGDAFRLACKLELDVMHRVVGGKRVEVLAAGGPLIQEFYEGNPYPAARRAIVRAAAFVARKRATKGAA